MSIATQNSTKVKGGCLARCNAVENPAFLLMGHSCNSLDGADHVNLQPIGAIAGERNMEAAGSAGAFNPTLTQASASESNLPRVAVSNLSVAKRTALVACFRGGGTLYKRAGVWRPDPVGTSETRICGNTVADLSRDGMVTLTVIGKQASARLTPRGEWLARTAIEELVAPR